MEETLSGDAISVCVFRWYLMICLFLFRCNLLAFLHVTFRFFGVCLMGKRVVLCLCGTLYQSVCVCRRGVQLLTAWWRLVIHWLVESQLLLPFCCVMNIQAFTVMHTVHQAASSGSVLILHVRLADVRYLRRCMKVNIFHDIVCIFISRISRCRRVVCRIDSTSAVMIICRIRSKIQQRLCVLLFCTKVVPDHNSYEQLLQMNWGMLVIVSLEFSLVFLGLVFLCDFCISFYHCEFDQFQFTCLERLVSQMTWYMSSEMLNYSVTHFTLYVTNWLYHSLAMWVSWWIMVFVSVLIVLSVKKTQSTSSPQLSLVKTVCQGMAEI